MIHHPNGSRVATRANPDYFTGEVWMTPVMTVPEPGRLQALMVRFSPGARTAWHTHPFGQTIYVISGKGLICRRGETPKVILPGDTVYFEAGEEHWHGAAPDFAMSHMAMQEADETGSAATWLEQVSDADYLR